MDRYPYPSGGQSPRPDRGGSSRPAPRRRRQSKMPYYLVLAGMAAAIVAILIAAAVSGFGEEPALSSGASLPGSAVQAGVPQSGVAPSGEPAQSQSPASQSPASQAAPVESNASLALDDWRLMLANSDNLIPEDYVPEVRALPTEYCQEAGYEFDVRAIDRAQAMIKAARADGEHLIVLSAYRPVSSQIRLYNNKVQQYLDQGYTQADAEATAATIVARPRTSDHNLGLGMDITSLDESYENTSQFRWLKAHAAEYGFVLRYPKEKQEITGITYEPWHWRYVGEEHAAKMNELGMCLEEYVEYLLKR